MDEEGFVFVVPIKGADGIWRRTCLYGSASMEVLKLWLFFLETNGGCTDFGDIEILWGTPPTPADLTREQTRQ